MIKNFVHRLLVKRHFWRTAAFDELSEIYSSMFLRSLAINIIGIFVPVYLYKVGYSLRSLFFMYFVWFIVKPLFSVPVARFIGRFGPKHAMAVANVIYIVYLILLISIEALRWPLPFIAVIGSLASTTFLIAFEVDFSKVKHPEHGGKELGYEQICERVGAVIGPLIGGLAATFVEPRFAIGLAIIVLCGSVIPIFMSSEPTHIHQKIVFKGFPFKRHKWDFISGVAFNVENIVTILIWPVFISITVIAKNTYATLGLLSALGTLVALFTIYSIGKLIDGRKGGLLLKLAASGNAILHLFRPFASSLGFVLGVNLANEALTAGYRIPYAKGRYDAADSVTGYRIVYLALTDMILSMGNSVFLLLCWALTFAIAPITVLKIAFIVGAVASLGIISQRFTALKDS
jgi:MFS family permease